MSRRTAEANKAIRLAWEREQKLVAEGKGTRDWTSEQQQDILDPNKGKAYDENGRAFEGQHMKSVAEYPEYQGNPNNIQFLTKEEHLAAHKGSWQNPTNWYYNPATKTFTDFGDGNVIPCIPEKLSNPIVDVKKIEKNANPIDDTNSSIEKIQTLKSYKTNRTKSSDLKRKDRNIGNIKKGIKSVGDFVIKHPRSIEAAAIVIKGAVDIISIAKGSSSRKTKLTNLNIDKPNSAKTDIVSKIADVVEITERNAPGENVVPKHRQRYHTKQGVKWVEKESYHRSGKSNK